MRAFLSLALSASLAAYAQQPAPQTPPPAQNAAATNPSPSTSTPPTASPDAVTVPAGTTVQLFLTNPLNSRTAQVGDAVHAEVAFPVVVNQRLVIPRGAFADGAVTKVTRPGFSHHANITIQFTRIIFENGYSVSLTSATAQASAAATTTAPFAMLFFQMPPPLPPLPGPPKGFIIGAAVGGAVAIFLLVYGITHRGGEIYLHTGWQIDMVLQSPVAIDADRALAPLPQ